MKPLMSQQVQRGIELNEWESSEHQATYDGLLDFHKRQQERKDRMQAKPSKVVTQLKKVVR